jgi:hypothetical protein
MSARFAALAVLLVSHLVACKERGTITVPIVEPCAGADASEVAIYLKRATTCASLTCGLRSFECADDCIPLCVDGYCSLDEARSGLAVDPPAAGDYAMVMSYRFAGAATDQGLVCFELRVDADGTTSSMVMPEEGEQCCIP